ncbi:hypothetical protein STRDD11_00218 [Streptococcus sp. DD11]|nr:hypothetical protein STRDD11_00218 [Streptococcus sp. DD11]
MGCLGKWMPCQKQKIILFPKEKSKGNKTAAIYYFLYFIILF